MENGNSTLEKWNAYNQMVNDRLIKHLQTLQIKNDRIHVLMAHLVNAQLIWIERMLRRPNTMGPFEPQTLETLIQLNDQNTAQTFSIMVHQSLEEKISYINTKGQKFENSIHEILIHLFNHASYHRGQINQLLVAEGHAPLVSDFIFYNRTPLL
ncbi:MAG: DinB family protein [bacterium]|nr:DinB family protein [bacterium]